MQGGILNELNSAKNLDNLFRDLNIKDKTTLNVIKNTINTQKSTIETKNSDEKVKQEALNLFKSCISATGEILSSFFAVSAGVASAAEIVKQKAEEFGRRPFPQLLVPEAKFCPNSSYSLFFKIELGFLRI